MAHLFPDSNATTDDEGVFILLASVHHSVKGRLKVLFRGGKILKLPKQ